MDQNPKQTVGFPPKSGPFDDLRVLDLTRVLAGPYATMILGDLGAEIIKVEQPEIGDEARGFGPFQNDFSLYFMSVNRGKKSITLNLKTDQGQQIFHDLLAKCDVLVENFRAGTMSKLGLGYDQLREKYPRHNICCLFWFWPDRPLCQSWCLRHDNPSNGGYSKHYWRA